MSAGRQMGGHFATHSLDENGNWKNLTAQKNSSFANISLQAYCIGSDAQEYIIELMWYAGYGEEHMELIMAGGYIDDWVIHVPLPMLPCAIYITQWFFHQAGYQCDIPKLMTYVPEWK